MEYMQIIAGGVGLAVAIWALLLQRREIVKNARMRALIHTSQMLQEKIDHYSKIIDDKKAQGEKFEEWRNLANRVHKEFRPLKKKINNEFIKLASTYSNVLHEKEIREALNSKQENHLSEPCQLLHGNPILRNKKGS